MEQAITRSIVKWHDNDNDNDILHLGIVCYGRHFNWRHYIWMIMYFKCGQIFVVHHVIMVIQYNIFHIAIFFNVIMTLKSLTLCLI